MIRAGGAATASTSSLNGYRNEPSTHISLILSQSEAAKMIKEEGVAGTLAAMDCTSNEKTVSFLSSVCLF
jgi:hypothetical protein